jgi:hypothetical protein
MLLASLLLLAPARASAQEFSCPGHCGAGDALFWTAYALFHGATNRPHVDPPRPITVADPETELRSRLVVAWWLHPERPAAQRRVDVWTLWNDADQSPQPDAARAQIEAYVRHNIWGADGFTDEELARFNRQRAKPPLFAPYDPLWRHALR